MKKQEKQTIRSESNESLLKTITDLQNKLNTLRLARFTKPSKNLREIKSLRQKLSVLLTILHEKETQS
jgi:ribosomal protein L29